MLIILSCICLFIKGWIKYQCGAYITGFIFIFYIFGTSVYIVITALNFVNNINFLVFKLLYVVAY